MNLNPMERHRRHCRETRAQMSDYLDGELDPQPAHAVKRHVLWCPSCRRFLTNLNRTISGLHRLAEQPTPVDAPRP